MEYIKEFIEFIHAQAEHIIAIVAVVDIILGALPNSWVKYRGIILSVATNMKNYDIQPHYVIQPPPKEDK